MSNSGDRLEFSGSTKRDAGNLLALVGALWLWSMEAEARTPAESGVAADAEDPSPVRVRDLKTEHVSEPLGVEAPHPRFRWLLESDDRGQLQSAYQVLVASSLAKLQAGIADRWDSGRVTSDNSVEVVYDGRALASAERVYWRVRIWDQKGRPSAYSKPSVFEMGLLQASDWQGRWIAAKPGISAPLLRREFSIDAPVRRARVYVSGLGYYELSINGKRIGDRVLEPASTYYHNDQPFKLASRVLYSVYDVTAVLRKGANALGIMLGCGWYSAEADAPFRTPYGDRPRLILQMSVELTDGHAFSVVSDGLWKTTAGPITYNDLAQGESYDARLAQPGWDRAGFNDVAWEVAAPVQAPSSTLTPELLPPTRVIANVPVVKMLSPRGPASHFFQQTYLYDFGQHFTGWVRLAVSGPRGAKLVLRYGSRLYEDNTLDTRSNEPPIVGARQTDTYILKGEGTEIWEPRFALHGFRYVEVKGFTDAPSLQTIEGRFVRSDVESIGSFDSSNELINRIHRNIQWTFASSLQGILQDAAERAEREAWIGDPSFVVEDYLSNYDMVGFLEKWLEDIRDSQFDDGDIPMLAPLHLRGSVEIPQGAWPSWQSTYPILVWDTYQYYRDRQVLARHYPNLKKLVAFLRATSQGDLIADEPIGDHMEPQAEGHTSFEAQHTPRALTASAYYYEHVFLLSQIASALGRSDDARAYGALALRIKAAFNHKFFDARTNQYATGSQTSNALPLYLGLVPDGNIPAVRKNLVEDIVAKHDTHVSTGIIGSNALVQVLPEQGEADLMYRLATQTTYPSLGHQVMMGATAVCENYECAPWHSQNMKMFGSLDKYFYRNLAGIHLQSPGYRLVLIEPQPVGDLRSVTASERTVRGLISVAWVRDGHSFDLRVSIPAGTEADIAVPMPGGPGSAAIAEGTATVWNAGAYVPGTAGLTGAHSEAKAIIFHAGSGSYHFILHGAAH